MAERTCVGCRCTADRGELVRVVWREGGLDVDVARSAPGRGAWLCASAGCFERAASRGAFGRALRRLVPADAVVAVRAAFDEAAAAMAARRSDTMSSSGSETRSGD